MMWTKSGVLKILDFGLAQLTQEVTAETPSKKLVGTVEYMSPEQVNTPHSVDHRSDLYSLGATLFYLLTGRSMFVGEPLQIAMDQVRKVPPLYEVRADIDLRLDAIFQKLVAKDPIDRFQTAESVIAKLDALHLSSKKSFAMPSLSDSPLRNAEPTTNRPFGESTSQRSYDAVGIELGQMTTRASYLDNNRQLIEIPLDGEHRFIRNILWSDQEWIAVGEVASQLRATQPNQIFYGFQRWIGIPVFGAIVCGSTHSSRNLASHSPSKGLRCLPSSTAANFPCGRQRAGVLRPTSSSLDPHSLPRCRHRTLAVIGSSTGSSSRPDGDPKTTEHIIE